MRTSPFRMLIPAALFLAANLFAKDKEPKPAPPPPEISDRLNAEYFKSSAEVATLQLQFEQTPLGKQLAKAREQLKSAADQISAKCGATFEPAFDQKTGFVICSPKPAAPPEK